MLLLPPHLLDAVIKNPTAVLTNRGLVQPKDNGSEELLIGIPLARDLFGEHFDQIRSGRSGEVATPVVVATEAPEVQVQVEVQTETSTEQPETVAEVAPVDPPADPAPAADPAESPSDAEKPAKSK